MERIRIRRSSKRLTAVAAAVLVIATAAPSSAHQDYSYAPNGVSPWHYTESYPITNWFGENFHRDYVNGVHYNDHHALDFGMPCWRRLYAMYEGMTVTRVNHNDGTLEMQKSINGRRYRVKYLHMAQINVGPGAVVGTNSVVGYSGTKGHSTGCHLHLSVHVLSGDGWWYSIQPFFCGRAYPHDHVTYWRGC